MTTANHRGRRRRGLAAVTMLAAATACARTTLDPSTLQDLQDSLAGLRKPMTVSDLARFDEALGYLVGESSPAPVDSTDAGEVLALYRPLAGRTADGIVAEATFHRVREVRWAVRAMEAWRDSNLEARDELTRFRFTDARVFKRHRGYLEWPVIQVTVENGTGFTISLIHFRASLLIPGDDAPWLVEEFDQVVMEGMAPGEGRMWRIEPEKQEWIRLIDPHPDLRFTIEAMRLVGRGGRVLATTDWGAVEDNRLTTFRRTLRVIRTTGSLALDLPPRPTVPALAVEPVRIVRVESSP